MTAVEVDRYRRLHRQLTPSRTWSLTMSNFGDFQNGVYADAVRGVNTRYPFDFASVERKASEALPDWRIAMCRRPGVTGGPSVRTSPLDHVDSWTLGFRPMDLERGGFPQWPLKRFVLE